MDFRNFKQIAFESKNPTGLLLDKVVDTKDFGFVEFSGVSLVQTCWKNQSESS